MQSTMIYLIGMSGTGKYTIAQHIAHHGYRVVDNHLINNPILSLIKLDGVTPVPYEAWDAIGKIRKIVFDFIACEQSTNYVLTNEVLETDEDRALYKQVLELSSKRKALFVPVRFTISSAQHTKRITSPGRAERFKSTAWTEDDQRKQLITIAHQNLLELDVTNLTAQESAKKILSHVARLQIAASPSS